MNPAKISFVLLFSAALAQAAPPSVPSPNRYRPLWDDSPFTTKPVVVGPEVINPFEDYALGGVTPLDGGDYLVTLLNKKKPEERVRIPGNTLGIKILEVHPGTKGPLTTTVMISNGAKSGLVSFDEKLLVLKAPVAAKQQPGQPNPNGQPGMPNPNGTGLPQPVPQPQIQQPTNSGNPNIQAPGGNNRPPRPRVVPVPPTR